MGGLGRWWVWIRVRYYQPINFKRFMYENTDPGTIKDKVDDFYKRDGSDGSLEDR